MRSSPALELAVAVACTLLFAVPLGLALREKRLFPFAMGALFWGAAVLVKIAFSLAIVAVAALASPNPRAEEAGTWVHAFQGANSAFWELGFTLLFVLGVRRASPGVRNVVFFGLGAGGLEAVIFAAAPLMAWLGDPALHNRHALLAVGVFAERAITLFGHVTSRVLLYAGTLRPPRTAWAAVASFMLFAFVDGLAGYLAAPGRWDFNRPAVYFTFLAIAGGAFALEGVLAWLALRFVKRTAIPVASGEPK